MGSLSLLSCPWVSPSSRCFCLSWCLPALLLKIRMLTDVLWSCGRPGRRAKFRYRFPYRSRHTYSSTRLWMSLCQRNCFEGMKRWQLWSLSLQEVSWTLHFYCFFPEMLGKTPSSEVFSIPALTVLGFLIGSVGELANGISTQLTEAVEVDDCVHSLWWKPKEDVSKHWYLPHERDAPFPFLKNCGNTGTNRPLLVLEKEKKNETSTKLNVIEYVGYI